MSEQRSKQKNNLITEHSRAAKSLIYNYPGDVLVPLVGAPNKPCNAGPPDDIIQQFLNSINKLQPLSMEREAIELLLDNNYMMPLSEIKKSNRLITASIVSGQDIDVDFFANRKTFFEVQDIGKEDKLVMLKIK